MAIRGSDGGCTCETGGDGSRWEETGGDGRRREEMGGDGRRWDEMGGDGTRRLVHLACLAVASGRAAPRAVVQKREAAVALGMVVRAFGAARGHLLRHIEARVLDLPKIGHGGGQSW
jgi:hypothetical protein